jgi:hypothetical protein
MQYYKSVEFVFLCVINCHIARPVFIWYGLNWAASVLYNTSYFTKWRAVIGLLHWTYQISLYTWIPAKCLCLCDVIATNVENASLIGRAMVLVIMYVETFKIDVIVFISIKRHNVASHWPIFSSVLVTKLVLAISHQRSYIKPTNQRRSVQILIYCKPSIRWSNIIPVTFFVNFDLVQPYAK